MSKHLVVVLLVGILINFQACGSLTPGSGSSGTSTSLSTADNFSGACLTANDCAGSEICVSGRTCIVNILSTGCECNNSDTDGTCIDFSGTSHQGKACVLSGVTCFGGMAVCCQGLSCNNGTCEGPSGRCPFTLAQ